MQQNMILTKIESCNSIVNQCSCFWHGLTFRLHQPVVQIASQWAAACMRPLEHCANLDSIGYVSCRREPTGAVLL